MKLSENAKADYETRFFMLSTEVAWEFVSVESFYCLEMSDILKNIFYECRTKYSQGVHEFNQT